MKTGTTTLAIMCKDGIVTAADKRATAGHMVVNRDIEKVIVVNERLVMTIAGSVSDIQLLSKYIKAELRIHSLRIGRMSTVKEAANLLSSLVYSGIRNYFPAITHFVLSGKDEQGYHIYDIFPDGSISDIKDFVSSGSGSIFALGLLEGNYHTDIDIKQGIELAKQAMNSALVRDSASGNGADIYTVDENGITKAESIIINTGIPRK